MLAQVRQPCSYLVPSPPQIVNPGGLELRHLVICRQVCYRILQRHRHGRWQRRKRYRRKHRTGTGLQESQTTFWRQGSGYERNKQVMGLSEENRQIGYVCKKNVESYRYGSRNLTRLSLEEVSYVFSYVRKCFLSTHF